jgi:hypothetical protein
MIPKPKLPGKRITRKNVPVPPSSASANGVPSLVTELRTKLPPARATETTTAALRTSHYYLNNRKKFLQQIRQILEPYRTEEEEKAATGDTMTCSKLAASGKGSGGDNERRLLTHQKVVRDYLNLYSPYRGLLLYHGLGSGKTCTSIAIAEGLKSQKRVYVMTPASLETNFWEQLKQCGDDLYKKDQYWKFVSTEGQPDDREAFHQVLQLPLDFIDQQKGVWFVDASKPSNFGELDTTAKRQIDAQLDVMIRAKYVNLHYNGLTRAKVDALTRNGTINPFDHAVVIVDEAHNLVSRIVNKLPKGGSGSTAAKKGSDKTPSSLAMIMYQLLMGAVDAKVVLLSGTPIVNYPNEVGVLYNMLRGYIRTWSWTLSIGGDASKVTTETIKTMLDRAGLTMYDYVKYSGNRLTVTRNPYGFVHGQGRGRAKAATATVGGTTRRNRLPLPKKARTTRRRHRLPIPSKSSKIPPAIVPVDPDNPEDHIYHLEADLQYVGENEPHMGGGGGEDEGEPEAASSGSAVYDGVYLDDTGNLTDAQFTEKIKQVLKTHGIEVVGRVKMEVHTCLPDSRDTFFSTFIDTTTGSLKQVDVFQRRTLGLTSYFPNSNEALMPAFVPSGNDTPKEGSDAENERAEDTRVDTVEGIFHLVRAPMSEYQFGVYEKIRHDEEEKEKSAKKAQRQAAKRRPDGAIDNSLYDMASSYRIFSRAACNFAFPDPPGRPLPPKRQKNNADADADADAGADASDDAAVPLDEDTFNATPPAVVRDTEDSPVMDVEEEYVPPADEYTQRIQSAMDTINQDEYLTGVGLQRYSPKFAAILANLRDDAHRGLHLLYSNFRTIEGIGLMRLVLLLNGFAEFKVTRTSEGWDMVETSEEDVGKPRFVLYTGTESAEEKEIVRNVYNGNWDLLPTRLADRLRTQAPHNQYGEIIKVFMITASGAEGINLKNTRYVHLMEPYWHMVRMEQVIGRARRICSHEDLPPELRTVQVWLYMATLTERQKTDDKYIELRNRDVSRLDGRQVITTDEALFEMATVKHRLNNNLLRTMQATAIDCGTYPTHRDQGTPPVVCYTMGRVQSDQFASFPALEQDAAEQTTGDVVKQVDLVLRSVTIQGKKYDLHEATMELYDHTQVMRAKKVPGTELVPIGKLVKEGRGYRIDTNNA